MEMITLRYNGGRSLVKSYYNRKQYVFSKANDFIAEVPIELAKRLLMTRQYLPVAKSAPQESKFDGVGNMVNLNDNLTCDICGFKAKSVQGLLVHQGKHKRGG
jgi:hypothetical protein